MQMNGITALVTIAKYWRRWADPRLIVMVLNNRDLNMVTWEQRALAGDPKFEASQDLPLRFRMPVRAMLGLRGISVDRPDEVGPAWDRRSARTGRCSEMVTDPDVPPLAARQHQAERAFGEALMKGDPDTAGVLKQTLKQIFA